MEAKKDLTEETMQESEYVKEAMVKGEGREIEGFVDKGEVEEPKMKHMEANKDIAKETMQESEDVKKEMVKRQGTEINYILDEGEGEEPDMMHMETKKDMTKETVQESKDLKEVMAKREGKETENFADKGEGEEPKRMHMKTKKDLTKEAIMQECKDVKEAMGKRKRKEIEYFVDKGEGEEHKRMHMKEKKDLTTEKMHQTGDVKEVMVKRKHREIENFVDKCEDKEPTRKQMKAKKDSKKLKIQESEDVKEAMIKRKGEETEYVVDNGEEPKIMHMEEKDLIGKKFQESEDVKEAMVTREGKKVTDYFSYQGEDEEPNMMHIEAKRDSTKETMQEREEIKEATIKRKGKETECFAGKGGSTQPKRMQTKAKEINGEEPKMLPMEEKKDLTIETTKESENVKEAMVKREGKEINYFLDEGEGDQEPNKMLREAKKDLRTETMQESDVKEEIVKRKGKETECLVVHGEGSKNPKRIHMEVKKDLTKEAMQENEYVIEEMVKRKGKEIDYFVDKGESEELRKTRMEAKKDITKETMQEEIEELKNGIEVPTEEFPKLVGGQDGSRGLNVANTEEQKDMVKEAMAETKSLKEKVKGEKSKKTEEEGRVIKNNTATEILQKEIEESNIETKSRDAPYVQDNMVKVVFEVLGTFQAKLPKHVMEAIAQNKKDKNEYVIVKFKGDGSARMHVEPNEAFDEDEIVEITEKEIRKSKLKSSDQISGKENLHVGVFDESKRPKFPEMAETKDVKEHSAQIKESVKKANEDKYEKIQVEQNGDLRKDIAGEHTQTKREGSKIQTMEKDQHRLQEKMSKGRFEASMAVKEEFPMKTVDSLSDKREGLKGTNIDEAKMAKQELIKKKGEERKSDVKEKGAEIEQLVKKVKEKCEKIQIEAKEGLRKDIHITKGKDQQCLQEGTSKGRYEASTTTREFPMQIADPPTKTRERTKDKEMEKLAKGKSEETNFVEFTIEENIQVPESGRISVTFKEVLEDKHPKVLEIGPPERELQSTKCPTTSAKVVGVGFKEVEQMSAKHKTHKTKQLPPNIQSKETHESIKGVKQDTIKPKKKKEVEGEQCAYNIERSKEVARFPSTKQTKVEEKDHLYGGKTEAFIESQKGDPTKDMKSIIEMKDHKESQQRKSLKPEIPLEKHLKKGEPITRKDESSKGQKLMETMQEEIEGHKDKIVDRYQHEQRYVAKGIGKLDTIEEEMHKKENVEDVGTVAKRMEMASEFKQDVKKMHESDDREHQRDSKVVIPKREVTSLTSTPKNGAENLKKEERLPIPMAIQRKEPHELPFPSKDYKTPKVEEVQRKRERKRPIHALEATTSREEELAQATTTHSKAKSEIDEPQVNQQPSPFIEMRSKDPRELEKHGREEDDSKADTLVHMREGKKYAHSIEGKSTTASEVVADEVAEPSNFSSSSSTQPFEVEGKYKIDANRDEESQESTKDEPDEEVEQRETLQPESPEDQQCINKDRIESPVTHAIEENTSELADKAGQEDSQLLEEQKECEEEATGGKKNNQKRSKKLFVSMIIAGSALLASGIFLFIRHRRARKGGK